MRLSGCLAPKRSPKTQRGRIFIGADGARAGWRLSLYLLLLLGLLVPAYYTIIALVDFLPHALRRPPFHPLFMVLNELMFLVPVCLATFIMAYLEGRCLTHYGLQHYARFQRFGLGVALGVACLVLLMGALQLLGAADTKVGGLSSIADLRYGVEWLAVSMMAAFMEEFMYRGYFLVTLAGSIGFWPAAIVSSILFAVTHGTTNTEALVGLVQVAAIAMLFCFSLRRTGSLWCAIGIHTGWDYAENFLFGTHDSGVSSYATLLTTTPHGNVLLSGGAVGPEGSLLGLAVLLTLAIVLNIIYPASKSQTRPILA